MKQYIRNIGIALTQLLNALLGGNPDVMTSARSHRYRDKWPWSWLAWALNKIDPGHTKRAHDSDKDEWS